MIKLTTSTDAQTIKVIPRSYATSVSMVFRDDSTNTSVTYTSSATTTKNHLVISQALALKEGRFYDLTIKQGTDVIYKDKVFCTDQTVDQDTNNYYSVNDGEYTIDTSYDNDYIIL
tara:strand:- start:656 stop:1003 length:348 start_codon:yes stop_codon:yes gene_type:complete